MYHCIFIYVLNTSGWQTLNQLALVLETGCLPVEETIFPKLPSLSSNYIRNTHYAAYPSVRPATVTRSWKRLPRCDMIHWNSARAVGRYEHFGSYVPFFYSYTCIYIITIKRSGWGMPFSPPPFNGVWRPPKFREIIQREWNIILSLRKNISF